VNDRTPNTPVARPDSYPGGQQAVSGAGNLFDRLTPAATTTALLSPAGLPGRIRVARSFLQIEAGSTWRWDAGLKALVDATGADRVLLAPVARMMLRNGHAFEDMTCPG